MGKKTSAKKSPGAEAKEDSADSAAEAGVTPKRAKPHGAAGTSLAPAQGVKGPSQSKGRPSALVDTRVVYCGDNLEHLKKLPDACIDLIYIDPPFNSNRNYEVFWGETKEKRAFEDRHASTQAYIDYIRPRCMEPSRVLKKTGSFYYLAAGTTHYVKADSAATAYQNV